MDWTVRESNPGGAKFSTPIQTSPRAHPAFYAGSAKVKQKVELYLYSPSGPSWI